MSDNIEKDKNDKLIKDIEEKILKGEFSTNSILIDGVIDNEFEEEEEEEGEDVILQLENEFDFENGVIEGFDMKKFNEGYTNSSNKGEVEFIEDVAGLQSIIENIDKYEDKVQEATPGLFVFKKDN